MYKLQPLSFLTVEEIDAEFEQFINKKIPETRKNYINLRIEMWNDTAYSRKERYKEEALKQDTMNPYTLGRILQNADLTPSACFWYTDSKHIRIGRKLMINQFIGVQLPNPGKEIIYRVSVGGLAEEWSTAYTTLEDVQMNIDKCVALKETLLSRLLDKLTCGRYTLLGDK